MALTPCQYRVPPQQHTYSVQIMEDGEANIWVCGRCGIRTPWSVGDYAEAYAEGDRLMREIAQWRTAQLQRSVWMGSANTARETQPMTPHHPDTPTWQYLVETRTQPSNLPGSPAEASYLAARGELAWELVGPPVRVSVAIPGRVPEVSGWCYYWKRRRAAAEVQEDLPPDID